MKFIQILILISLYGGEAYASMHEDTDEAQPRRKKLTISVDKVPDTFFPSPMYLVTPDSNTPLDSYIETEDNSPSLYLDSRPQTGIGRSLFSEHFIGKNKFSAIDCLQTLLNDCSCSFINQNYYVSELSSETPTSVRDIYKLHRVHNFPFNYQEVPRATLKIFDTSKPILKGAAERLIKLLDSPVFLQDVSDGFFPPILSLNRFYSHNKEYYILITKYVAGQSYAEMLRSASTHLEEDHLIKHTKSIAKFMAAFHNRTRHLPPGSSTWLSYSIFGDANVGNFIVKNNGDIIAIDPDTRATALTSPTNGSLDLIKFTSTMRRCLYGNTQLFEVLKDTFSTSYYAAIES